MIFFIFLITSLFISCSPKQSQTNLISTQTNNTINQVAAMNPEPVIEIPKEPEIPIVNYRVNSGLGLSPLGISVDTRDSIIVRYRVTGRNRDDNTTFDFLLTPEEFVKFREAIEKYIEWEDIAIKNNVESFERSIPITITSNSVRWQNQSLRTRHAMLKGDLQLEFKFRWTGTIGLTKGKGILYLNSNRVNSEVIEGLYSSGSLTINLRGMQMDDMKKFLSETTNEMVIAKIQSEVEKAEKKESEKNLFN